MAFLSPFVHLSAREGTPLGTEHAFWGTLLVEKI